MKSISKLAIAASLVLAMAFTFSCSKDDDDGGGGGGGLSGTSWERKNSSGNSFDFTYTITFESDTKMSHLYKGWGMVGSSRRNYNETTNGTYEYFPNIKEGIIHCSVFTGGLFVFAISDDGQTMSSKTSSMVFKRK